VAAPGLSHGRQTIKLKAQAVEIATDGQALAHELHSSKPAALGIATAMRGFCEEFAEQKRVKVDFAAHDVPDQLPSDISLCLFRVLQEALYNAAKHSNVEHFDVELWG